MNISKTFKTLALIAALALPAAHAQEVKPEPTKTGKGSILETAKEVAVHGSVDGKRLFYVVGIDQASEVTKELWENGVVTEDDISDITENSEDLAKHIYNKEHKNDAVDWVKEGAEFTGDAAEETAEFAARTFTRPWKSIEKIPGAVKVDLEHGSDAYHGSKNSVVGAAKYSAWAVVAFLHGSYYLVIEAPVRMVLNATATAFCAASTVLAMPITIAGIALRTAWDAAKVLWIPVRIVLRNAGKGIVTAAVWTYTAISVGITEVAIFTVGGVMAVGRGLQFVFAELPGRAKFPVQAKAITDAAFDRIGDSAAIIQNFVKNEKLSGLKDAQVTADVSKYSATMDITAVVDGKRMNVARMKLGTKNAKMTVKLMYTRELYKHIRSEGGLTRKQTRAQLKDSATVMLNKIQDLFSTSAVADSGVSLESGLAPAI